MSPILQRLSARGSGLLQRFKPQSASVRNVLKLAGSTAGAQVFSFAAAPIVTRLYGPESYGVLATFLSLLGLISIVSSLRYELAIAVPEDDDEAIALVWLCFVLVGISTALTALGVVLLGDQLVSWLRQPALKPLLWLLPVGVLLSGIYLPLSYWAIRRKQFGLLAKTQFRQSLLGIATNLAAAPLGTIGLLLGQIVSQSSGCLAIMRLSFVDLWNCPNASPDGLFKALRRYGHFGIYSSPAGLINTIGNQLPNLIFASAFGAAQLGQLALAQRLILLPAGLISSSVAQVFLSQAAERYRAGTLPALMRQAGKKLLIYGVTTALLISFFVAPLMPLLFGYEWQPTRWIIPLLIPLYLGQLVMSPLSMAFVVSELNTNDMVAQIGLALIRVGVLMACIRVGFSFQHVIFSYSIACFAGYALYGLMLRQVFTRCNSVER